MARTANPQNENAVDREKVKRLSRMSSTTELAEIATIFQQTTKSQSELLKATGENLQEMLKALEVSQQTMDELLAVITNQAEKVQEQMEKLLAVTAALTRAVTILRTIPPGSPTP